MDSGTSFAPPNLFPNHPGHHDTPSIDTDPSGNHDLPSIDTDPPGNTGDYRLVFRCLLFINPRWLIDEKTSNTKSSSRFEILRYHTRANSPCVQGNMTRNAPLDNRDYCAVFENNLEFKLAYSHC